MPPRRSSSTRPRSTARSISRTRPALRRRRSTHGFRRRRSRRGTDGKYRGNPFNEALNLPTGRFDRAIAGSKFRVPDRGFAVSSNNPSFVQPARSFSAFHATDRRAVVREPRISGFPRAPHDQIYQQPRSSQVYIDINRNLPDGTPNPEFLQPYRQGYRLRMPAVGAQSESTRAALAYVLKRSGWVTLIQHLAWQHSNSNSVSDPTVFTAKRSTDPRTWVTPAYTDVVYYRYYWDKPDLPTPEVPSVNYNGTTYQTGWVKDIGGTTVVPAINYTTLDTLQAALKGVLFKGRIHLLGAARNDHYIAYSRFSRVPGDYPRIGMARPTTIVRMLPPTTARSAPLIRRKRPPASRPGRRCRHRHAPARASSRRRSMLATVS